MIIKRDIQPRLVKLASSFPVVVVTGPRQAGKTTLLKATFKDHHYYNLENPQTLAKITSDPAGLINVRTKKIVLDEVQRLPELLSYIQAVVDEQHLMGNFILSGSENLLLSDKVNQSLAGRASYLTLLPLSLTELSQVELAPKNVYQSIFQGFYPALYKQKSSPITYYDQYLATYVERDVKQISQIVHLNNFRRFLMLVASRIGQVINYSDLARDVGVSPNTIEAWLSVLEASYIIFRLPPYYQNFGKRYIKSPKLYFYDTGLACRLLGLVSVDELESSFFLGGLFENLVILEIKKHLQNFAKPAKLYYFRDVHGHEVDLLIDQGLTQIPIEIKASATFSKSYLKGINYWKELVKARKPHAKQVLPGFVIYNGDQSYAGQYHLTSWSDLDDLFKLIKSVKE